MKKVWIFRRSLHLRSLIWSTDIRSVFGWTPSEYPIVCYNPPIRPARLYSQISLDKTADLISGRDQTKWRYLEIHATYLTYLSQTFWRCFARLRRDVRVCVRESAPCRRQFLFCQFSLSRRRCETKQRRQWSGRRQCCWRVCGIARDSDFDKFTD